MLVLLLTNRRDLTTDYLVRELGKRQLSFIRLNTDSLADQYFVLDPVHQEIEIKGQSLHFRIEDVSVAYFRRPSIPFPDPSIGAYRNYVWTEWNTFLKALCAIVGDRWFNHPNSIMLAENKVRQLGLADQIGFSVPETIVTNDLSAVKELQMNFTLVAKPLKQALVDDGDNSSVLFTSQVDELSDDDLASVAACPAIFQRRIPKEIDLRVTVVGSKVLGIIYRSHNRSRSVILPDGLDGHGLKRHPRKLFRRRVDAHIFLNLRFARLVGRGTHPHHRLVIGHSLLPYAARGIFGFRPSKKSSMV